MRSNKALATPEYIGDIMNGRRDTIPLRDRPDTSLPLALWVDGAEKPTCLLEITACIDDGEGWTVQIRPWIYEDTPRLLRAGSPLTGGGKARLMSGRKRTFKNPKAKPPDDRKWTKAHELGYTENPSLALLDAGEAIDDWAQEQYAEQALQRDEQRRVKQDAAAKRARELLSIEERMVQARAAAQLNYIDISSEMFLIRRAKAKNRSEQAVIQHLEVAERRAYRDAA